MTTIETALSRPAEVFDNRVSFAEELIAQARDDERVVAVCNDSVGSSNLVAFREEFPDRLINVGIAEQNLVGVAAGLANAGMIPFACAVARASAIWTAIASSLGIGNGPPAIACRSVWPSISSMTM